MTKGFTLTDGKYVEPEWLREAQARIAAAHAKQTVCCCCGGDPDGSCVNGNKVCGSSRKCFDYAIQHPTPEVDAVLYQGEIQWCPEEICAQGREAVIAWAKEHHGKQQPPK